MRKNIQSWNKTFMDFAKIIAKRSKDPSTQVGAVLVSPDKTRIHIGYNGFVTGMSETEEKWKRPAKYIRSCHAEINSILHAREDLHNWTLYVTSIPCGDCSKYIAQAGIKTIHFIDDVNKNSKLDYDTFFRICEEMDIKVIKYDE